MKPRDFTLAKRGIARLTREKKRKSCENLVLICGLNLSDLGYLRNRL